MRCQTRYRWTEGRTDGWTISKSFSRQAVTSLCETIIWYHRSTAGFPGCYADCNFISNFTLGYQYSKLINNIFFLSMISTVVQKLNHKSYKTNLQQQNDRNKKWENQCTLSKCSHACMNSWFHNVSNYWQNSMIYPIWFFQNSLFLRCFGLFHDFSRGCKPWRMKENKTTHVHHIKIYKMSTWSISSRIIIRVVYKRQGKNYWAILKIEVKRI